MVEVITSEVYTAKNLEEAALRALKKPQHLDFIREGVLLAIYARDHQVKALIALLRWANEAP